jgi:hypothetical protein
MKKNILKLILILLLITSCNGRLLQFDSAPEPQYDLSKNPITIEGIYQVNDFNNETLSDIREQFTNNDFKNYQLPGLHRNYADTLTYFAKIFFSDEFMEIKKSSNSYIINTFNAINKKVYYDFFNSETRVIKDKENTLKLFSRIVDDSLFLTSSENQKKDTIFKFKVKVVGDLICFENSNTKKLIDSIPFTQKQKANTYFSKSKDNFYVVNKDTSTSNYEIKRIEFNDNKINIFGYNQIDSLIKLNKLPIKDSTGTIIYSSELLAKLKGSEIETKILSFVKIENFEYDKDNSNNGKWFIIIISLLLIIVVAMVLKSKSKSVV